MLVTTYLYLLFRSARYVVEKAIGNARKFKYFDGVETDGFLDYYEEMINSDLQSVTEWYRLVYIFYERTELYTEFTYPT